MNLLFDLYGVLLKTQTPAARAELEELTGAGPEMWETYWRLRPGYDAGQLSDEEYWARFREEMNLASFSTAAVIEADFRSWLEPDAEMIEYVVGLKRAGHRVGLLSNIPRGLAERVLARFDFLGEFDAVAMSWEMGVEKPQAGAYRVALEKLGTRPGDTHFFDDNAANVRAARECGLNAHVFRRIDDVREVVG